MNATIKRIRDARAAKLAPVVVEEAPSVVEAPVVDIIKPKAPRKPRVKKTDVSKDI